MLNQIIWPKRTRVEIAMEGPLNCCNHVLSCVLQELLQHVDSSALRYPAHKALVVFNFKIFELFWETGSGVRTILHELNYHCTVKSAMLFKTKRPALF